MEFSIEAPLATEITRNAINTKRKILIVEDNFINQEILTTILEDKYGILTAENGLVGLELLKKHYKDISLIILDVYMPVCNGYEFLEKIKENYLLSQVPIIVTTASEDPQDEISFLQMGVYDFVTKPYNAEIVRVRVDHAISLKETIANLSAVENDSLTNMYTMEAFNYKVQQILSMNSEKRFALMLADIQDFKLVNDTFGEEIGDHVLVEAAKAYRKYISFYAAARKGDKFYFLCDKLDKNIEANVKSICKEINDNIMIRTLNIKYGVYCDVDPSLSVSILCDRLDMAIDSIKNSYNEYLAFYDESMREKRLSDQRMEADFGPALENGEFYPWYQPKVDLQTGKIIAAEALVRWIPEMGKMVSPGMFIPLFECNGQIADLDEYIFTQVCCFQKQRLEAGKQVVPISVNLSRNSIYRHDIVKRYCEIVEEYALPLKMIPLEITESATTESKVVQRFITKANEAGFEIHMDDFGSGYSSISMLTSSVFKVVKFDKSLIDQIGTEKGEIVMKYMLGASHAIGLKVVAEGVEKQEQIDFLKAVGCDAIQGYYYSPPQCQSVFEQMLDADKPLGPKA